MCGRYALFFSKAELERAFKAECPFELPPRYNIAPGQAGPVVCAEKNGTRTIRLMRWGLVPSWAKDQSIGNRLINARAETAGEKPSFRASFRRRRVLVPANGFYEWKKETHGKQPYFIHHSDESPLAMGGIWDSWERGKGYLETFSILTTQAVPSLLSLHERMPVIISPENFDAWLDPDNDIMHIKKILSAREEDFEAFPVSKRVNNAENEGAELLKKPAQDAGKGDTE